MSEYKATSALLLPLDDAASVVEYWFGEAFKKPTPGVYVKGEEGPRELLQPLFMPQAGKKLELWQESGAELKSMADINSPVYDKSDRCVFSQADIWKGWTPAPSIPLVGRLLCESYMRDGMISQLRYLTPKRFRYTQVFQSWLQPQFAKDAALADRVVQLFEPLHAQVIEFIDGPTFDMHSMRRRHNDLVVEKFDDWRVYEYYRLAKQPYQA